MASSKIKGITIEIGGNTTKLQDALKGVDKQVYGLNSDLKALNQALKLDPKNTELLAQKHEVLARNIEASKQRLETLKEAQRQMGDYNKLTDEQKESYNQLSLEIAKSEAALKNMNTELKNTSKLDMSGIQEGLKKVGEVALDVSKKMLQVGAAISGALVGALTAGVKSYADLEKAQRGSERLFGESFNIVKKDAVDAYKTMGLSATQYLEQANTYAVGLTKSFGGNTEKAAKLTKDILQAQADIVTATGANADTVQNAFAALMRGNYQLIDNLRLGIGGTKIGMKEIIKEVNVWNKANGKATKYQLGNYADMQQALVDYVAMVGVAGTAQTQMSETISGSYTQMKAALDNFINGSGGVNELSSTITTFIRNISKTLQKLAPTLLTGIVNLMSTLMPEIARILISLVPQLLQSVTAMIDNVLELVAGDTTELQKTIDILIEAVVRFITNNLPKIIEIAIQIVVAIATGIVNNIDLLAPAIITCITEIIKIVIEHLPDFLGLGLKLIIELGKGLINAIPELIRKVPQIVESIVKSLKENAPKMVEAGKELTAGLWTGLKAKWDYYKAIGGGSGLAGWAKQVISDIKRKFGIASPSKLMRDEVGVNLGLGVVEGINDTIDDVEDAMSNLSNSVEESINPTINPSANTNPLYITIENFYNNRETDIQQLAEELEFYRKNSALAKGGV